MRTKHQIQLRTNDLIKELSQIKRYVNSMNSNVSDILYIKGLEEQISILKWVLNNG